MRKKLLVMARFLTPLRGPPVYKDKNVRDWLGGNSGVEAAIDLAGICPM
jgi:alkyl hydroperoxide reductase subunit AhpF